MRKILSSTKDHCCGTIEVICPCSKEVLSALVKFLYDGEIHCKEESESLKIIENLQTIFGFQRNLVLNFSPNEAFFASENNIEAAKGQLISKCPYEKSVSSKIPTKKFPRFLP